MNQLSFAEYVIELATLFNKRSKLNDPVHKEWVKAIQQCKDKSRHLKLGQLLRQEPLNVQLTALMEDWDENKITLKVFCKTWVAA